MALSGATTRAHAAAAASSSTAVSGRSTLKTPPGRASGPLGASWCRHSLPMRPTGSATSSSPRPGRSSSPGIRSPTTSQSRVTSGRPSIRSSCFRFVPDSVEDELPPGWPTEPLALRFLHQEVESCPDLDREFVVQACKSLPSFFVVESTEPTRQLSRSQRSCSLFARPRPPTLRAFAGRRAALVVPQASRIHDRPPDRSTKESAAGLAAG